MHPTIITVINHWNYHHTRLTQPHETRGGNQKSKRVHPDFGPRASSPGALTAFELQKRKDPQGRKDAARTRLAIEDERPQEEKARRLSTALPWIVMVNWGDRQTHFWWHSCRVENYWFSISMLHLYKAFCGWNFNTWLLTQIFGNC